MARYLFSGTSRLDGRNGLVRRIAFFILILAVSHFLLSFSSSASAQDYQAAYSAVENLASQIRMDEGAVAQTLSEAMQANHGDLSKWQAIDEKMTALGQTIDRNLPDIGRNLAILRSIDPDRSTPSVGLGRTFEGNLDMARRKKQQLLDMAKEENAKLNKINQMIAKVDRDLLNAAKGLMGATLEGFMPDEISLAGEASIIVLGAYFGPPGIAAAGLAWAAAGTFNSMVNLYYNTKGAADQTKALGGMKQGLQARKAELEKNISTLMAGAREMEQIEQILDKHEKKMNEYKAKISAAVDGWNEQSKAAFEDRKKKLEEEARKRAAEPKPEIRVGLWVYGAGEITPIAPGEYAGEIDSMISQMESYTRGVEDGGDPDNFQIMVLDWYKGISDKYGRAKQDYDKKYEAYGRASETCYQQTWAAWQEAQRAWNALSASCRPWNDSCRAASAAIGARYDAAVKAAYAGLAPYGKALVDPYREMVKLSNIMYRVENAYYPFRDRVDNATRARTREFWNESTAWETKFSDANAKAWDAVSNVPYWIDQWKERAAKLDDQIKYALDWGSNIADVRSSLLATATQLKDLDKTVKESAKKYTEANSERLRVSNQAQGELTSLLNKWGRLIGYYWASNFYISSWYGGSTEFTPHAPDMERNIAYLTERMKNTFKVYEPENLKNAQKMDILGIAAIYENKAQELTFYTDWVDTYRHRLSTAAGALTRISHETTKQGFYANREAGLLSKELSAPPWGPIAQEVEKYVTKEDFAQIPWGRYQPWDGLNVWQKLYAAQQILLTKLGKEARYYIQARSSGWFQPVSPAIMKPLEDAWTNLRKVCERYDALAKPAREEIGNSPEEVLKAAQPVFETYNKMPGLSRNVVAEEHRRFSSAYNWLNTYLTSKLDALKPSLEPPTNSTAVQLDNLILNYSALFEKYKRDQEEAEKRMEEARRQAAEAEKRRQEEEQRRAEEEKKKAEADVAVVQNLYNQFKQAYESRNDALVVSFLSNDWRATDGSTIADLQANLRRTFRVFDEIRYNIQNLKIGSAGGGTFSASYDLTITSRIFKRNIKHEEKSSVVDEIILDASGKAKIARTVGGAFWSAQ
jgi:hypothetical protein